MNKTIKRTILILLLILVSISTVYQLKFEKYIDNQKEKFGILVNRRRISYIPVVIYYSMNANSEMRNLNRKASDLIDQERNFAGRIIIVGYDEYIMQCYYTNEEKVNYLNSYGLVK